MFPLTKDPSSQSSFESIQAVETTETRKVKGYHEGEERYREYWEDRGERSFSKIRNGVIISGEEDAG